MIFRFLFSFKSRKIVREGVKERIAFIGNFSGEATCTAHATVWFVSYTACAECFYTAVRCRRYKEKPACIGIHLTPLWRPLLPPTGPALVLYLLATAGSAWKYCDIISRVFGSCTVFLPRTLVEFQCGAERRKRGGEGWRYSRCNIFQDVRLLLFTSWLVPHP